MEALVGPGREFLEHIAEVGEGFHAVELAGLDEGVEGGRSFAPGIVPGKEEVLATDGNPPQRPLHGIVIDAEAPLLGDRGSAPSSASAHSRWPWQGRFWGPLASGYR